MLTTTTTTTLHLPLLSDNNDNKSPILHSTTTTTDVVQLVQDAMLEAEIQFAKLDSKQENAMLSGGMHILDFGTEANTIL